MTNLALSLFNGMDMNGLGLWAFLSIGAISLFVVFIPLTSWIENRRKERESFYKAETLRRIAESSGEGAKMAMEMIRQDNRQQAIKKREGMKVGGLINIGVGVALMVFLGFLVRDEPVFLCGLIPAMIGAALLVYAHFLAAPVE